MSPRLEWIERQTSEKEDTGMNSGKNFAVRCPAEMKFRVCSFRYWVATCLFSAALLALPFRAAAGEEVRPHTKAVSYTNEAVPSGPWSIHVIKIERAQLERANPEYELQTSLANGTISGMTTLSEQVKA